jgi:hypothetical protein
MSSRRAAHRNPGAPPAAEAGERSCHITALEQALHLLRANHPAALPSPDDDLAFYRSHEYAPSHRLVVSVPSISPAAIRSNTRVRVRSDPQAWGGHQVAIGYRVSADPQRHAYQLRMASRGPCLSIGSDGGETG